MFRLKNPPESDDNRPTIATQRQEPAEEPPVAKPPPRRTLPMPPRPVDGQSFPESARRSNVAPTPTRADTGAARDKSLVIGKEVQLKGEVSACDKIILEGDAEVTLTDTQHLQIGASGWFRGAANVAEADVAGHFEGDLVVRERLTVRPTGRLRGTIRYAQITIEAGGQITGEMTMLEAPATVTSDPQTATQPVGASSEAEPKALADQP
jgi:cytoskeletal protein CcmA (bactofilin family)